jgi:hypothetical protein
MTALPQGLLPNISNTTDKTEWIDRFPPRPHAVGSGRRYSGMSALRCLGLFWTSSLIGHSDLSDDIVGQLSQRATHGVSNRLTTLPIQLCLYRATPGRAELARMMNGPVNVQYDLA